MSASWCARLNGVCLKLWVSQRHGQNNLLRDMDKTTMVYILIWKLSLFFSVKVPDVYKVACEKLQYSRISRMFRSAFLGHLCFVLYFVFVCLFQKELACVLLYVFWSQNNSFAILLLPVKIEVGLPREWGAQKNYTVWLWYIISKLFISGF